MLTSTSISFSTYGALFAIGAKSLMRRSLVSGFVSPVSNSTLLSLRDSLRSLYM